MDIIKIEKVILKDGRKVSFSIRNGMIDGKVHIEVSVKEDMVGHKFGEFSPTKKFVKHGGKMHEYDDQQQDSAFAGG